MQKIVLASASPRRKMLLEQIGLKFIVMPSAIKENVTADKDPVMLAKKLSLQKAETVADSIKKDAVLNRESIVIGADTLVEIDGHVMGKPLGSEEAKHMLRKLSGRWHRVITGVAVIGLSENKYLVKAESTRVKIRRLNEEKILKYVETKEPLDKAGAYGIQGKGALLVEKIDGCYFNVVGLPIGCLSIMLEEFGIKIL